jgi:hypothetical protein
MIDPPQLERLLAWMLEHRDALKFVVTSVPFVAEVNDAQKNAAPDWYDAGEARPRNPANDKWSAAQFKAQRDRIIEFIGTEQLERVVFLTGDMHCCYHASMRIFKPSHNEPPVRAQSKYESIIVHELGAGPINQLMLADFEEFHARRRARAGAFVYEIVLDRFHTQVNAVMHLKVAYEERDDVRSKSPDPRVLAPEIEWNVIRTLADASAWDSWWAKTDDPKDPPTRPGELAMTGRISFTRRRTRQELVKWPEVARG